MRSQDPSDSRTDLILDHLSGGVVAVDRSATITYLNAAAARTLALQPDTALGKPLATLLGRAATEALSLEDVFAGQPYVNREAEWPRASGEPCLVGFSASPCREADGTIAGAVISFREIGPLLARRQERARAEQLAALGLIAAGLAHEVRNPLAGLRSTAQALARKLPPREPQRDYLDRMLAEIDRIDALLRTFLQYARPQRPTLKPVPLPDVIGSVAALLREQLATRHVRLSTEFPKQNPRVIGDPQQLQQVFLNLFLNSLQAMHNGGEIRVQARWLEEALAWEVRVHDSGRGIPAEHLAQAFTPFFSTTPQGSGLGLAIVQQIVREHRGQVTIESRAGQGTTVTVRLPAASPPPGPPTAH
jgi:PAS domain S-box-containing protein